MTIGHRLLPHLLPGNGPGGSRVHAGLRDRAGQDRDQALAVR
jgi:hypothetical protein